MVANDSVEGLFASTVIEDIMNTKLTKKIRRKYWIRFYWSECVLCGKPENYKERVYCDVEPKPNDPDKRHVFGCQWACYSHFM